MVKDVFNSRDKVTSFEVAMALMESINSFSGKSIQNDKSRHSYFGIIVRDVEGDSWDIDIYKLPKVGKPKNQRPDQSEVEPPPIKNAAFIFCNDDGMVYMDMGGYDNGYDDGSHMEISIKTKGALDKFLSTFHQTYLIHIADQQDREYMGSDFGRNKKIPGLRKG